MEDLGALGFWLMIGMIVAASILAEALKEREKQATLRALLETEGGSATEVLAYMREKDAAEAAAKAAEAARSHAGWVRFRRRLPALATGVLAVVLGFAVGGALRSGPFRSPESPVVPLAVMFGIWVVGLAVAWWMWRCAKQDDARPDR